MHDERGDASAASREWADAIAEGTGGWINLVLYRATFSSYARGAEQKRNHQWESSMEWSLP